MNINNVTDIGCQILVLRIFINIQSTSRHINFIEIFTNNFPNIFIQNQANYKSLSHNNILDFKMTLCCNTHKDYQLIINEGFAFIKSNIKWFSQFIHLHQVNIFTKNARNINEVIGYCHLTKSKNPIHLKGVNSKHLVQLVETNMWNLLISLEYFPETRSFYFKHDKLPKLLTIFTNHTNRLFFFRYLPNNIPL